MAIRTSDRKLIQVDVPAEFFLLQVPPGWVSRKWYREESKRLARMFPAPKVECIEVRPEFAEMQAAISAFRAWAEKKDLWKLALREEMQWAQYATVNGERIAKRQQYHVKSYEVGDYDVDTIINT